jgi:hypothetical protein
MTKEATFMNPAKTPVIARRLDLNALLQQKSHFLFGPRRVGNIDVLPLTTFLERLWSGKYS